MREERLAWEDPWLASLDLEYHNVNPDRGLFLGLEAEGKTWRMTSERDIAQALVAGPSDTRGGLRGIVCETVPGADHGDAMGAGRSGKTLLACAILNVLTLKYGIETRYCKVSRDFIQAIKDTFNKKNGWGDPDTDIAAKIEKDLQTVPFLVLDDFGITKDTEWAFEKFYNLIDTRYEYNRPTILTSNKPLEMWKGIFENRIYSRLCEMTKQVFFESLDFRELHKETT
jgi:hypothetical protein